MTNPSDTEITARHARLERTGAWRPMTKEVEALCAVIRAAVNADWERGPDGLLRRRKANHETKT